jgi:hypothetical protein
MSIPRRDRAVGHRAPRARRSGTRLPAARGTRSSVIRPSALRSPRTFTTQIPERVGVGDPEIRQRVRAQTLHPRQPLIGRIVLAEPLDGARRADATAVAIDPEAHEQLRIQRRTPRGPFDGPHPVCERRQIYLADKLPDRARCGPPESAPRRSRAGAASACDQWPVVAAAPLWHPRGHARRTRRGSEGPADALAHRSCDSLLISYDENTCRMRVR